jgi:lipopolysaccharide transport system permease protein
MIKPMWLIRPKEPLISLRITELKQYRYLISQLIYRDLIASYKQTLLGPAWLIVHPLITTFIFSIVFGRIIKISTDGLPQPVFYLSGIICWNYFSECLLRTSTVFKDNANIFGKVYFPRIIVPLSLSISMFFRLMIHVLLLIIIMLIVPHQPYQISVMRIITIVPLVIALIAMLGVGLGLIFACLTIKFKDLNFVIIFSLQVTMYTTTVIFPLSSAPKNMIPFISANPITGLIEAFRYALFDTGSLGLFNSAYCITFPIVLFSIGYMTFNRMERTYIDYI